MRTSLVIALACLSACGGKSTAPSNHPTGPAADSEPPAPVLETPQAALAYLAPDVDTVLGLDIAALMAAPILAPYRDRVLAETPSELRELRERCGLDPIRDLRWLVFGFNAASEQGVVIVRGDFTQEAIESCVKKSSGAAATISSQGDLRVYTFGEDKLFVRWLGRGAAVVTSEEAGGAEVLDRALGSGGVSKALATQIDQVDNGSHMWLVAGEQAFKQAPVQGAIGVRLFARVTDILSAGLVMDFDSTARADSTKAQLDMALAQVGPMVGQEMVPIVKALHLAVVGSALEARIELTAAQIKAISDLVEKSF